MSGAAPTLFLDGRVTLHAGDCLDVLAFVGLADRGGIVAGIGLVCARLEQLPDAQHSAAGATVCCARPAPRSAFAGDARRRLSHSRPEPACPRAFV